MSQSERREPSLQDAGLRSAEYYRDLKRRHLLRLFASYVAPLVLLAGYFYFQYNRLEKRAHLNHLKAIATDRSRMLDLCLEERLSDLETLARAASTVTPSVAAPEAPDGLRLGGHDFVTVDIVDSAGTMLVRWGPILQPPTHRNHELLTALRDGRRRTIVSNVYLEPDNKAYFDLAVRLDDGAQARFAVARVDPLKVHDYLFGHEESSDLRTVVVDNEGRFQMVVGAIARLTDSSTLTPPSSPLLGSAEAVFRNHDMTYAYGRLSQADWILLAVPAELRDGSWLSGFRRPLLGFSLILVMVLSFVVVSRAGSIVRTQKDSDRTRAQLEHAAKLASVGELAAGIAHEINNPLAVISEEAGLMADFLNPQLSQRPSDTELVHHLDSIQEAVYRCRDITRKLLRFVRRTDVDLRAHNIHAMIDAVVDGPLGTEIVISNAEIVRRYDHSLPSVPTDRNQFQQVLVNILKNALDALDAKPGTITITTTGRDKQVRVAIADTGHGMTSEQLGQVFVPFFTTKEVGKGTGLGLSVSYGIMRSLGGSIEVASEAGKGSVFTLVLPTG